MIFDVGFNPEDTTARWHGIKIVSFEMVINSKLPVTYIGFNEANCEMRYYDMNNNNIPLIIDVKLIIN